MADERRNGVDLDSIVSDSQRRVTTNVAQTDNNKNTNFSCKYGATTIVNFPHQKMPFPDGTIITNQFKESGILFSSTNPQDNYIQDKVLFNPLNVKFITKKPVMTVSVTLRDYNSHDQTHTLYAYDRHNNIVDKATFTELPLYLYPNGGTVPDRFTITVSSCDGIAYVVVSESPLGTEGLELITYGVVE